MKMKLALAIARDLQIYFYNVTVVKLGTYDLIHQGDFHNNYEFPIMDAFVARERETVYSRRKSNTVTNVTYHWQLSGLELAHQQEVCHSLKVYM